MCCKPDDGKFYVQCEECSEWFHPDCLSKKDNLAGLFSKMEWKNITIKCPKNNKRIVYHHFAPTNKKSSYNDSHSIFDYKNTTSPSHITLKQEVCLKAKNVEVIFNNYYSSIYQDKNLQIQLIKFAFPKVELNMKLKTNL